MSEPAAYTPYHPRWFRRRVSTYWWLWRWPYFTFILRETSSVFVAWTVAYLLLLVRALGRDVAGYEQFLAWSESPPVLLLNVVSLIFIVIHAMTWFSLAPQAMVMHLGGRRVPGILIAVSNYAAWVVASAAVVWLLLGV